MMNRSINRNTVKRSVSFILGMILVFILASGSSSICFGYTGGNGTPEKPFGIASKAELLTLAASPRDYDKCFILKTDIDLAGESFSTAVIAPHTGGSTGDFEGTRFTGVFDGNGHEIRNLTISGGGKVVIGFFGFISSSRAEIRNLYLVDVDISGKDIVGGLAGYNEEGTIDSCHVTGVISGTGLDVGGLLGRNQSGTVRFCRTITGMTGQYNVGGLVGYNEYSSIFSCSTDGFMNGHSTIGGMVGFNGGSTLVDCEAAISVSGIGGNLGGLVGVNTSSPIATCSATGTVFGTNKVGGLAGENLNSSLTYCYAAGSVTGNSNVGGLVGWNYIVDYTIDFCYATGSVDAITYAGGLIGSNYFGTITSCYATGSVSGIVSHVGGLMGASDRGKVIRCYSAGMVTGVSEVGGFCGASYTGPEYEDTENFWDVERSGTFDSAMGIGKTTEEMKTLSTFTDADWDFMAVWDMEPRQTYPYLRTYLASDLNMDGEVNLQDFAIFALQWMES